MKNSMKDKVMFIVSLLFGLLFIVFGFDKFIHFMPMPKELPEKMMKAFLAFKEIGWLMPLVGTAEILGGLLVIIPRTRALGALIIFPVMVGIVLTNIVQDQSGLPIAGIFSAILVWIIIDNKEKYLPIIK